jgi:hypothetical protein
VIFSRVITNIETRKGFLNVFKAYFEAVNEALAEVSQGLLQWAQIHRTRINVTISDIYSKQVGGKCFLYVLDIILIYL